MWNNYYFRDKKRRASIISHFRGKSSASTTASQQTLQDVSSTLSQESCIDSPPPPPLPRRWSDATGTPRAKKIVAEQQQQKFMSPVVSMPCLTLKQSLDHLDVMRIPSMNASPRRSRGMQNLSPEKNNATSDEEFVRIPKREYEAIKIRVSAIEKRISREFELVQNTKSSADLSNHRASNDIMPSNDNDELMESPTLQHATRRGHRQSIDNVQDKYVRALEETEELNRSTGGTDELAKRLGRDLKIRRSVEHKIIRSPSARKIGSIRRRSRDHNCSKLNRTKSLNITTTTSSVDQLAVIDNDDDEEGAFCPRQTSNLRRGRPNTIQTGLKVHRSPPEKRTIPDLQKNNAAMTIRRRSATISTGLDIVKTKPSTTLVNGLSEFYPAGGDEEWTDAKDFFAERPQPIGYMVNVTPKRIEANERRGSLRSAGKKECGGGETPVISNPADNMLKTPMLPPKRAPRKTPASAMAKNHYLTPLQQAQQTGRASIARIRSQNAGMVLAKARLFNDLEDGGEKIVGGTASLDIRRVKEVPVAMQKENRTAETPKTFVTSFRKPQIKPVMLANSPRRLIKTPSRERATPVRALPRSPRVGRAI